jgi:CysZ protein
MTLLKGISYNFRGLKLGIKTPSLLALGMIRFGVILILSLLAIGLVIAKYQQVANLIWTQPESVWILWLWHVFSWVLALLLAAVSTLVAFLIAQLLFSIVIMDYMSRITERKVTGYEVAPPAMPWFSYFFYLLKQEIPRAVIPIVISMGILIVGWLTPLSPIVTIVSPILAVTFLAWDNTDLIPARRLEPIGNRFRFLRKNLKFHVGFGLGFLIPGLNILLLSYAPVGATMFYVEQIEGGMGKPASPAGNVPDKAHPGVA